MTSIGVVNKGEQPSFNRFGLLEPVSLHGFLINHWPCYNFGNQLGAEFLTVSGTPSTVTRRTGSGL
jgi:hypothetical protein